MSVQWQPEIICPVSATYLSASGIPNADKTDTKLQLAGMLVATLFHRGQYLILLAIGSKQHTEFIGFLFTVMRLCWS